MVQKLYSLLLHAVCINLATKICMCEISIQNPQQNNYVRAWIFMMQTSVIAISKRKLHTIHAHEIYTNFYATYFLQI